MKEFGPSAEKEKVPSLDAALAEHVGYLFSHIYSLPFSYQENGARRSIHSILHASRAAIYIPAFANLYRKFGDQEAMAITNEDLKLVQIAALLHDAGREGDGVDLWDQDSGILTYKYLTKLGVSKEKAKLLAEAVTNKDTTTKNVTDEEIASAHYEELDISGDEPVWRQVPKKEKNIYQHLIHDADCLDIIRVRSVYEGKYLDFFKEIIQKNNDKMDTYPALVHLEKLIDEAVELVNETDRGQSRDAYENKNCLSALLKQIENKPLLTKFYSEKTLFDEKELQQINFSGNRYDPKKELDQDNIIAALREGKVFARAMNTPSQIVDKDQLHNNQCSNKEKYKQETVVGLELRKTKRRKGISTGSSKSDNKDKQGNLNRSISMIGYRRSVFKSVGFLLLNPPLDKIGKISEINAGTGRGKKKFVKELNDNKIKRQQLDELLWKFKLTRGDQSSYGHTEILCDIEEYHAVFFTNDINYNNSEDAINALRAIYIQQEYKNAFSKELPIFEYSVKQNTLVPKKYTETDLIEIWRKQLKETTANLISDSLLKIFNLYTTGSNSPDLIKSLITSTELSGFINNYTDAFKNKINDLLFSLLIDKLNDLSGIVPDLLLSQINNKDTTLLNKILGVCKSFSKNNLSKLVYSAIEKDNEDVIHLLLSSGFDINQPNDAGDTPLMQAVKSANITMVNKLLKFQADVNLLNPAENTTALHHAVSLEHLELVNCLLNAGANPNVVNSNGEMPLFLAIKVSHFEIIKALLNKNANPSLANNKSNNTLVISPTISDYDLLKALINYEDNIHYVDKRGNRLIHLAVGYNNDSLLINVIEKDPSIVNAQTKEGDTPLHLAIKNGHQGLIKILLANNADVTLKNALGTTPIALAMDQESLPILDIILEYINYATDLKAFNKNGQSILHIATHLNYLPVIKHLLEKDPTLINLPTKGGDTALHLAIYNRNFGVITYLLNHGANINLKDSAGYTALSLAFIAEDIGMIEALLNASKDKIDFNACNGYGYNILHIAVKKQNTTLISRILKSAPELINTKIHDASGSTALEMAIEHHDLPSIKLLLSAGADIYAKNAYDGPAWRALYNRSANDNFTSTFIDYIKESSQQDTIRDILFFAIYSGLDATIKKILENFPSLINAQNASAIGNTPLHVAILKNNSNLVTYLLNSGASISKRNSENMTPLRVAVEGGSNEAIISALIHHDKDLTLEREDLQGALTNCIKFGNSNTVALEIINKYDNIIDYKTDADETPLKLAVEKESTILVSRLLDLNANPNDSGSSTPLLQTAFQHFNVDIIKMLLAKGADHNATNINGVTPLMIASALTLEDNIFTELFNKDIDFKKLDNFGKSYLHHAVDHKNLYVANLILEKYPSLINLQTKDGDTALMFAARNGNVDLVNLLLKHGADPYLRNSENESSLSIATDIPYPKIVEAIVNQSQDIANHRDEIRFVLRQACIKNWISIAKKIIAIDHEIVNVNLNSDSASIDYPLILAAINNDTELAIFLLNNNANPNLITASAPLHYAAWKGNIELLQALLDKNADPNVKDITGNSPLDNAFEANHAKVYEILLDHINYTPDFKKVNKNGDNALHFAILSSNLTLVKKLLEKDPSLIGTLTRDGKTAIQRAVESNDNPDIVKLLISKNADPNIHDNTGETLLDKAFYNNNVKVYELLLDYINFIPDLKKTNNDGFNALHLAVKNSNLNLAKKLLENDPSLIQSLTKDGDTAIEIAVATNNLDMAKLLLQFGADPFYKNNGKSSAFEKALRNQEEITIAILDQVKDLAPYSEIINEALAYSCIHNKISIARKIIEKDNAIIKVKSNVYDTYPLQLAIINHHTEIACMLLDNNADPNILNDSGYTLLHEATWYGDLEVMKALIAKKVDPDSKHPKWGTALDYALRNKQDKAVELLLDHINCLPDFKAFSPDGYNALHIAVKNNNQTLAKKLLKIDPSLINTLMNNIKKYSPLHIAIENDNPEMVKILLESGADIHLKNNDCTPLHIAANSKHTDIIALLGDAGADFNLPDKNGRTPLDIAKESKDQEMIDLVNRYTKKRRISPSPSNDNQPSAKNTNVSLANSPLSFLGKRKIVEEDVCTNSPSISQIN